MPLDAFTSTHMHTQTQLQWNALSKCFVCRSNAKMLKSYSTTLLYSIHNSFVQFDSVALSPCIACMYLYTCVIVLVCYAIRDSLALSVSLLQPTHTAQRAMRERICPKSSNQYTCMQPIPRYPISKPCFNKPCNEQHIKRKCGKILECLCIGQNYKIFQCILCILRKPIASISRK